MTLVELVPKAFGTTPRSFRITHLSVELTNQCSKACSFCYNSSSATGATDWDNNALLGFLEDCAANGLEAVSLGGGEPLEYPGLFDLLDEIPTELGRSLTTNGIAVETDPRLLARLMASAIDKVHVSIHFPERRAEVERAIRLVATLQEGGIAGGVNLLVRHGKAAEAQKAYQTLADHGLRPDQVVLLPMKGALGPTAEDLAFVAGSQTSSQ